MKYFLIIGSLLMGNFSYGYCSKPIKPSLFYGASPLEKSVKLQEYQVDLQAYQICKQEEVERERDNKKASAEHRKRCKQNAANQDIWSALFSTYNPSAYGC